MPGINLSPEQLNYWNAVIRPGLVARTSTLNQQPLVSEIQKNIVAENKPIPVVYGHAQIGARPFAVDYTGGTWTVGYIICLGEIESFVDIWINGEAPVAGVTITYYTGTTVQTADPALAAAITDYTDTLVITDPAGDIGVAYIVLEYTDDDYDSWPRVVAEIEGKKVWNPKTGTTIYSENPALHLGDLLSSPIYGRGWTVDDTDLESLQDDCDDAVFGEIRRQSYLAITTANDTDTWIETLRAYASCFIVHRGDTVHLIPINEQYAPQSFPNGDVVWARRVLARIRPSQ